MVRYVEGKFRISVVASMQHTLLQAHQKDTKKTSNERKNGQGENYMLQKVITYINEYEMIQRGDKIIVGVSGGADSICLLFMLWQLQKQFDCTLHVVHVEHGLRGEAALEDCRYVEEFCGKLGISCQSFHADVDKLAKEEKLSVEEAGRKVRYELFYQECQRIGANKIAVAHNKKDCAETFLWNVVRGAGTKGMASIQPVRDTIIRPILCLDRKEIEEYLAEQGIAYRTDESNHSNAYTRNKIRNVIFPYMEQELNGQAVSHLAEAAMHMQQIHAYIAKQVEILWKQHGSLSGEEGVLTITGILAEPEFLIKELLLYAYQMVAGSKNNLTAVHLQQMYEICKKQSGKKIQLPNHMEVLKSGERLVIRKQKNSEEGFETELCIPGVTVLSRINSQLVANIKIPEKIGIFEKKTYTKCFDYDTIKCNLQVRTRRSGDYIMVQGGERKQSLKSYFINEKIPCEMRDSIPLLAAGSHILWIIGYRTSEACYVKSNTKRILEVQYVEELYERKN